MPQVGSRFVVSLEDVKNFLNVPAVNDSEGLHVSYTMPEEIVRAMLPPYMEYVSNVVSIYIYAIKHPNFGAPYMEAAFYIPTVVDGMNGSFCFQCFLKGEGAQSGVITGDQAAGIPKKFADDIVLERVGTWAHGKIVRGGVTLVDIVLDVNGVYNDPELGDVLCGHPQPGDEYVATNFFHKFEMCQTEEGNTEFRNVRLCYEDYHGEKAAYEEASIVSVAVASSENDPYGELVMVDPIGASWFTDSKGVMAGLHPVMDLDPDIAMPYCMTTRYDRGMMGSYQTRMSY